MWYAYALRFSSRCQVTSDSVKWVSEKLGVEVCRFPVLLPLVCTTACTIVEAVKLRLRALLVCDRDQYEVMLQSPLRCVTAAALSQADVEKRFPRGTPSDCNHLFLVTIRKQTESTEYIFACKQRLDNWYAVPPVRNLLEQFTSINGLLVRASLFVVRASGLW